jgi:hypothetical protein
MLLCFCPYLLCILSQWQSMSHRGSWSCCSWIYNYLCSDQERGNIMGHCSPIMTQHSMGHFSVVFVKTKIFYGPFKFVWGIYTELQNCMYQTAHGRCLSQSLLCNQYLSPLMLWVWTTFMARGTGYNMMWSTLSAILRQVGSFLWVLRFPPPMKQTYSPQYNWNIVESGVKHHKA